MTRSSDPDGSQQQMVYPKIYSLVIGKRIVYGQILFVNIKQRLIKNGSYIRWIIGIFV